MIGVPDFNQSALRPIARDTAQGRAPKSQREVGNKTGCQAVTKT